MKNPRDLEDAVLRHAIRLRTWLLDIGRRSIIGSFQRAEDLRVRWERDLLMAEANERGLKWQKYPILRPWWRPVLCITTVKAPVDRRYGMAWADDLLSQVAKGNLLRPLGQIQTG